MAETNLSEIAKQINTASRIVMDTDMFIIYSVNGIVKIPANLVRQYLVQGAALTDTLYQKAVGLVVEQLSTTAKIQPNTLNVWRMPVNKLDISFDSPIDGIINEYMMEFQLSTGELSVKLPDGLLWVNEPDWQENAKYQISVVDGLAVCGEWEQNS